VCEREREREGEREKVADGVAVKSEKLEDTTRWKKKEKRLNAVEYNILNIMRVSRCDNNNIIYH